MLKCIFGKFDDIKLYVTLNAYMYDFITAKENQADATYVWLPGELKWLRDFLHQAIWNYIKHQ